MSFSIKLEQFRTKHELARNFYDDNEFCPLYDTEEEAFEHRERVQKRASPHSSPSLSYYNSPTSTPPMKRSIPIINPANMAPVSIKPDSTWPNVSYNSRMYSHYYGCATQPTQPRKVIPIIDPATKQALPSPKYHVSVR
ncbi:hypothetical protein G6F70_004716 [Rhizopus microsporus]|uniref:Uncharacterized protein n=2 Tax=Rhizopus TaxID=4842 RepID=A0A0A1NX59_RHIZD|nr:hypothetical protein G6F71_005260 [Rhizopus microsporus]KAG1199663.1 hypothetical protein G6F70_004716 [Rhizopus microsporus]KAG1209106.1 hypothetical protein G6F69_006632 [Rhizopus microsporus]KAG1233325.1 hypothetical protein G6F67_004344 [Rhizopus microsporus]KAG1262715.1 hypothetical protein G6F68_005722 [Rhizopus microsporus]